MDTLMLPPVHRNEHLGSEIQVAYPDRRGNDCGLLLVPGWCESQAVFAPLIQMLPLNWRTLSVDLPGHGASPMPAPDFGLDEVAFATVEAIEKSGVERVIPVTHSHAGWVGIELHRRLGARIPKLVLLNWLVLDPPPAFATALRALQDPYRWRDASDQLFATWLGGAAPLRVTRHVVKDIGIHDASMWARAAREIELSYRRWGNPLKALAAFEPSLPTLHIYSQPRDDDYLHAQKEFARTHEWFTVRRLDARTHFPTLEAPEQVATSIRDFIASI